MQVTGHGSEVQIFPHPWPFGIRIRRALGAASFFAAHNKPKPARSGLVMVEYASRIADA